GRRSGHGERCGRLASARSQPGRARESEGPMRRSWVWGPVLATLGCNLGGRVDRFAPAKRPEGVAVALALRGGGRAQGELLAVQDTAPAVLVHSPVMLTVGLVGFGFAGKVFHAPVIRAVDGLRLDAIVQRHGEGAPDQRYADVDFVTSVDELLTRSVDLVVIATPNTSHHPIAKQCL